MIGANGDYLRAGLNQSREENLVLAGGAHLPDETHAGALRDVELGQTQKSRITQMNVNVAGGCLQQYVRAERGRLGVFRETQNRALQRDIFCNVVGAESWLRGHNIGAWPLRKGQTCTSTGAHCGYNETGLQEQLHQLTPFSRLGFVSTNPKIDFRFRVCKYQP